MVHDFIADDDLLVTFFREKKWWTKISNPWEMLERAESKLKKIHTHISEKAEIQEGATIRNNVCIDEGSKVANGAHIYGPSIIGKNCTIGPCSVIRPSSILGNETVLYPGSEVKNVIVGNGSIIGHFSYVGDSVIGKDCILGGGVITAVVRLDLDNVKCKTREKLVDTGRMKLGAFIGDGCRIGVGVLIMPGRRIGPNCQIGPGVIVYQNIEDSTMVLCKQKLIRKRPCLTEYIENSEKNELLRRSLRFSLQKEKSGDT